VDLFVLDDAVRPKPERKGMGPLCAVGGLYIPSSSVGTGGSVRLRPPYEGGAETYWTAAKDTFWGCGRLARKVRKVARFAAANPPGYDTA
jgi:hypothetical protein